MKTNPEIDDFDWEYIFDHFCGSPSRVAGDDVVSEAGFGIDDVDRVISISNGENDGLELIGVFMLRDKRYAFVKAGCDYTGWD